MERSMGEWGTLVPCLSVVYIGSVAQSPEKPIHTASGGLFACCFPNAARSRKGPVPFCPAPPRLSILSAGKRLFLWYNENRKVDYNGGHALKVRL